MQNKWTFIQVTDQYNMRERERERERKREKEKVLIKYIYLTKRMSWSLTFQDRIVAPDKVDEKLQVSYFKLHAL